MSAGLFLPTAAGVFLLTRSEIAAIIQRHRAGCPFSDREVECMIRLAATSLMLSVMLAHGFLGCCWHHDHTHAQASNESETDVANRQGDKCHAHSHGHSHSQHDGHPTGGPVNLARSTTTHEKPCPVLPRGNRLLKSETHSSRARNRAFCSDDAGDDHDHHSQTCEEDDCTFKTSDSVKLPVSRQSVPFEIQRIPGDQLAESLSQPRLTIARGSSVLSPALPLCAQPLTQVWRL